jgi:hypothetical protein
MSFCSYEKDCKKFKEGTFYSPTLGDISYYYIIRKGNRQIEIDKDNNRRKFFLKWHNECSYTITLANPEEYNFDKSFNSRLSDSIKVEFIETIKDTVYYNSKIYFKNEVYEVTGSKMIRIDDVPD